MGQFILTVSCRNTVGIVAAIATRLAANGGDIRQAQQFDDEETGSFFARIAVAMQDGTAAFEEGFSEDASRFDLKWTLRPADRKRKVLILVSKFDHCLGDLLYRMRIGELNMECVGIVSNHPASALNVTQHHGIPYHHFPISRDTKTEQEERIKRVITETGAELVILARYMQVLSDGFSAYLSGRCINIHHSFLPGFKGAKPYHQAHERGVKMIGATAHYVTGDLDEGPIISQDVEHVTHADTPDDLVSKGRDIERRVLARAVAYHLEDRVLINGRKTVVFT
ncbi:formyltetrahydrofolate deformylase [Shinella sp. BYT-45]|uniref:formyltetrahydrofolate deformylase n=1 Tax=Shinella sp. BYT-45 TaxID=3377377 RepID=UPI0039801C00